MRAFQRKQNRQRKRANRRSREGMTLIEIMVVMVIMALVATAAGFAILPQLKKAKIKQTSSDAKAIASASELYLSEHDNCPTTQELLAEKILDKNKNTHDGWGNDFSIECDQDGVTVRSPGPDGQMGTEDDIQ
jgi:general secretion pathway protein G